MLDADDVIKVGKCLLRANSVNEIGHPHDMNSSYRTIVEPPDAFSESELNSFVCLVESGGAVRREGLKERVKNARTLAMLYASDELVGTAAIKAPSAKYRCDVFLKAKSNLPAENYPFELGWVCISPRYRHQRLAGDLVGAAMNSHRNYDVFATTGNDCMHRMLTKKGFVQVGSPYDSNEHLNQQISLFVRERLSASLSS